MAEQYFQYTFPSGLTVVAEKMPAVQSAAMSLLLPAGSAGDAEGACGTATILADLVLRGAGKLDSRALTDHLDLLGLQRSSSVGVYHARFSCTAVSAKVIDSISTYADIIQRPHLPEKGFEAARELALAALAGLDDDPRQKLLFKLREWFLPSPFNRNSIGKVEDLQKLTIARCKSDWQKRYQASGAILSIAGDIDFSHVKAELEKYFGDFAAKETKPFQTVAPPGKNHHEKQKTEQTHIGVAYPSVLESDPDYYVMRLAVEILSGGMSGRLFTEIREKRALCYSVWAGYTGLRELGAILAYVGASNDRAQAALDCLIAEIRKLERGVTQPELDRAKTGLKAATILQGESTSARSGAIAHDYFMRGRLRTLDEIKDQIDRITLDHVNDFLRTHPAGPFTVVTVGPKSLTIPE